MKKFSILAVMALCGLFFNTANAQVRVRLGLNLGPVRVVYTARPEVIEQPVYDEQAPVYDDANDDDYYYLPDVGAYYDVNAGCYYYNDGYNWVSTAYLPGSYRNYDWRNARKFEIHEHRPFMRNDFYRSRFNGREVAEWKNYHHDNNWGRAERRDDQFDNRNDNFNRHNDSRANDNRFNNRPQVSFGQPNDNRGNNGSDRGNRDNRNGGQSARPSNQNNSGNNRGGDDHFARNMQPMGMSHRPRT